MAIVDIFDKVKEISFFICLLFSPIIFYMNLNETFVSIFPVRKMLYTKLNSYISVWFDDVWEIWGWNAEECFVDGNIDVMTSKFVR